MIYNIHQSTAILCWTGASLSLLLNIQGENTILTLCFLKFVCLELKLPERPAKATNGNAASPLNNMKTSKHSDIYWDLNTGLWLAKTGHVTSKLGSDWLKFGVFEYNTDAHIFYNTEVLTGPKKNVCSILEIFILRFFTAHT